MPGVERGRLGGHWRAAGGAGYPGAPVAANGFRPTREKSAQGKRSLNTFILTMGFHRRSPASPSNVSVLAMDRMQAFTCPVEAVRSEIIVESRGHLVFLFQHIQRKKESTCPLFFHFRKSRISPLSEQRFPADTRL